MCTREEAITGNPKGDEKNLEEAIISKT